MNKIILTAIILMALVGCGPVYDRAEIFPGAEAEMIAICNVNGGFKRGHLSERNDYHYKSVRVRTYRTEYFVVCNNGAQITRTLSRSGDP